MGKSTGARKPGATQPPRSDPATNPPVEPVTVALPSATTLYAVATAVFAVSLGVYLRTLHPSVAGGDAGELMCVAHERGTPHPPGYPTFAVYTRAAESLVAAVAPWAAPADLADWPTDPASAAATKASSSSSAPLSTRADGTHGIYTGYVQNASHAVLSALASALLFLAAAELTGCVASGVVAAGLFAWAPNVWTYAVVTEVFPLNNAFTAALLLLVVRFGNRSGLGNQQRVASSVASQQQQQQPGNRSGSASDNGGRVDGAAPPPSAVWVTGCALFCGFALTNQHTLVVFVAPIALWVILVRVRSVSLFLALVVAFLLGLSPYLYLPWSSSHVVSTNSWGKLNTWDGFWHHFLRREYGTFSLASKEATYRVSDFSRAWKYYLYDACEQTAFVFAPLPAIGALLVALRAFTDRLPTSSSASSSSSSWPAWFARLARTETLLLLVWFGYCTFFNVLSNLPIDKPLFYGVQQRFWIQPLQIVALFAATGYHAVASRAARVATATAAMAAVVGLVVRWRGRSC